MIAANDFANMRAVRYHETGSPDVLRVEDVDQPEPDDGELLIEIAAASVNHLDTLFRAGIDMFVPGSFPMVPGSDFAGTVAAVGAGVTDFEVGDRVLGAGLAGSPMGGYAEYTIASTSLVAPLPDGIGFEEAAGIGHVGVTTWRALVDHGRVEPGDTCLIHGGSGGVGHVAVQLAKAQGARVITSSSAESRRTTLRDLGADVVLDYTADSFQESVEAAAPSGVDVILDGHLDTYLQFDLEVLATGGRIVGIEFTGEEGGLASFSQFHTRLANWKEANLQWVAMPNAPDIPHILGRFTQLMESDVVRVQVAKTYALEEAADAHRAMAEERDVGTIVLVP